MTTTINNNDTIPGQPLAHYDPEVAQRVQCWLASGQLLAWIPILSQENFPGTPPEILQFADRHQESMRWPIHAPEDLLQEAAVPPWERERLPFLWCNDRLLWVGGLGADVAFVCTPGETGVLPVWVSSGSDHQETRMSMESKQCQ